MRRQLTPPERQLWKCLKAKSLGFVARRQFPVGPYFLDFYIASAGLCIEVDGAVHDLHSSRDRTRDEYLIQVGISTLRLTASDALERPAQCLALIADAVESRRNNPPPTA